MTMGSGGNEEQVLTMGDLLTNYLAIAKRGAKYWMRGTALFLLVIIPGMYWVSTHARVYKSEAQFQVSLPDVPNAQEQDMDTIQRSLENRAGHVYDSRNNILQVIRELNLYPQLQGTMSREKIVAYFQGAFTYRVDHDTIKIGFSYKDAGVAQRVVQRLVRLFTEERKLAELERARQNLATTGSQLEGLETTLGEREDALERFTNANQANVDIIRLRRGGAAPTPTNAPTQQNNDPGASPGTRRLRTRISELQRRIDGLRNPNQPPPPAAEEPESLRNARANVRQLREELATLRTQGLTDEHPRVQTAQRRLNEAQNQLNGELARNRQPVTQGMSDSERNAQIEQLQRELNTARAQLTTSEQSDHNTGAQPVAPVVVPAHNPLTLNTLPEVEAQYDRLIADLTTTRNEYQELLRRKFQQQAELSRIELSGGERIRMIDPPSLPVEPEPPGKAKLGGIVALVAIVLGLGVSLISGFLDTRVYDQGDLVRWGELPALPFIPELHADGAPRIPAQPPGAGSPPTPV